MKKAAILVLIFFSLQYPLYAQQVQNQKQTNAQLAIVYYNSKDFEKALPLLYETYKNSGNTYYFRLYLNVLMELKRFDEAEKEITREIRKQRSPNPEMLIDLGRVYEVQGKDEESSGKYEEAINAIPGNKGSYILTANTFLQWAKYEYAEKVYLKGRELFPEEPFSYELARVYMYLRNYEQMMEEYLNLIRVNEDQLARVQSSLASALRLDIDDGLRDQFRGQVLKRIQAEPQVTGYNRLLIWFFLQEKKFSGALRQSIALDKRTNQEDTRIFELGLMAINNKSYEDAGNAFRYIMDKGDKHPLYYQSFLQNLEVSYQQFIHESPENKKNANILSESFQTGLETLGISAVTLNIIIDYAHLLAFYMDAPDRALDILNKATGIPKLKPEELGRLKTEIADIHVYSGDPWEATLLYSQVIDANKNNTLGDEVKLKKARLGYYLGNFSWAKAQLDVLKASTSKLTANDAMELSLLITGNLNLDTTAIPLQMFSRADFHFFRNHDSLAVSTLDSISELYPYHTLQDEILFRKAQIEKRNQNYELAVSYLEKIVTTFSYESLADDALFQLAEMNYYELGDKKKALAWYKQMILEFPGSIYVEESRDKYRELREIYPEELTPDSQDQLHDNKTPVPDEFE